MRLAACAGLATRPVAGTWYRAIRLQFWNSLMATAHTATVPGRFNAGNIARPGFEILYFAEDHQVALFEVRALIGSPLASAAYAPNPAAPWVVINVGIQLSQVVDFTKASKRKQIRTSAQELTGDWECYLLRNSNPTLMAPYWSNVPTQRLGQALHDVPNLEGFLTYSSKVPTKQNLIVFPSKLRPGSHIQFHNPITGDVVAIP